MFKHTLTHINIYRTRIKTCYITIQNVQVHIIIYKVLKTSNIIRVYFKTL